MVIKKCLLGFIAAITFVLALPITNSAAAASDDFDSFIFMANEITDPDTTSNLLYYDYLHNYKSGAEIWKDSLSKDFVNSCKSWAAVNLVLNPDDISKKAVDYRENYVNILLSILNENTYSESVFSKIKNSQAYQLATDAGSLLKSFSDIYKKYIGTTFNIDYLTKTDYTTTNKMQFIEIQEKWLKEDSRFVKLGSKVGNIVKYLNGLSSFTEIYDSVMNFAMLYNLSVEWKECVNYLYEHSGNNFALNSSLKAISSYMNSSDWEDIAYNYLLSDGGMKFSSWAISKGLEVLTDRFLVAFPAYTGIYIGKVIGGSLTDLLFGTEDTVESYYNINAYCDIMDLIRQSVLEHEKIFVSNKTKKNAKLFLTFTDIYFTSFKIGCEYGKDFAKILMQGGIINKLVYTDNQYNNYLTTADETETYAETAKNSIFKEWVHSLYYVNKSAYNEVVELLYNTGVDLDYVDSSSIEFEKSSVEWGLKDYDHSGCKLIYKPINSTIKNVKYTSSNNNIAYIDNIGIPHVVNTGKCEITATLVSNPDIKSTLKVTVVSQNGLDSRFYQASELPVQPDKNRLSEGKQFEIGDIRYEVLKDNNSVEVDICDRDKSGNVIVPSKVCYNGNIYNVVGLGKYSFEYCRNVTGVHLLDGLTSIGDLSFASCSSLVSVNIPSTVTSIGFSAFDYTPILDNQSSDIKYVGNWAIECKKDVTSASIKSGTVGLADDAFRVCSIESVTIPKSVKIIGNAAFWGCEKLKSVKLPDSVVSIGNTAFEMCSNLNSINIPDSVKRIGYDAFYLTPILYAQKTEVQYVGNWVVFCDIRAKSVKILDGTKGIADEAFAINSYFESSLLSKIIIPSSVKIIGKGAFYRCSFLSDIYYTGSKSQWQSILINDLNGKLSNASIHYDYGKPSSVTGLKLKARAADALRLTWTKNDSADGYIIEMKSGNSWTRVSKITNNSTVEFKKSKLKAGTAYTFRITAYKMDGKTAFYSSYTTISARTNPSVVSGLKLKARAADALRLTWTKNDSADGYIIEMKDGSKWVRVGKITKNSTVEFKKSKLKAGTTYTFRVKAYKMSGKTALYGATKTISVRTNPSSTTGLKLKNSAKNAVRLSWTKNTSADGYIVEMKVNGVWKRAGKISKNSTVEFKKSGLKSKTSYAFRVKAYKMSGKTALYGATKTITVKTK